MGILLNTALTHQQSRAMESYGELRRAMGEKVCLGFTHQQSRAMESYGELRTATDSYCDLQKALVSIDSWTWMRKYIYCYCNKAQNCFTNTLSPFKLCNKALSQSAFSFYDLEVKHFGLTGQIYYLGGAPNKFSSASSVVFAPSLYLKLDPL